MDTFHRRANVLICKITDAMRPAALHIQCC